MRIALIAFSSVVLLLGQAAAAPSPELVSEHPEIAEFPDLAPHCLRHGTEWVESSPQNGGMGSAECYAEWLSHREIVERSRKPPRASAATED